jgi:glycosyltransferase XagB
MSFTNKTRADILFFTKLFSLISFTSKPKREQIVPFSKEMVILEGQGFHYKGNKFIHHTDLPHQESAFRRFSSPQIASILGIIGIIFLGLLINWHATFVLIIATLTVLYFTDLLFNLFLIIRSFSRTPEIKIPTSEIKKLGDNIWPTYTILCPLYKEWEVIPQFVTAMSHLDYPKNKLQVILILEENDPETIQNARAMKLPKYFEVLIVPHSMPKTKPKACNYALKYAKGEYVVIYDAEDIPDPLQLKKAYLAFTKVSGNVACIQAKLNFYNPHQNILTRAFTAEYSLWFDLVLTGLQSISAPIPLGGTSNHFRTQILKDLKGWDSFNVTEDCDLGIRLVKKGYKTALVDSTTLEEANSDLKNWFNQRTRWIKGYIQTYFVHMRHPKEFLSHWKEPHVITFQLIVGGKILSMFINPLMWIITLTYFIARPIVGTFIESFFPSPVLYMAVFSLVIGNFLYMYYYMIGCAKREYYDIIKYAFLVPFYWLGMSAAAWVAFQEFLVNPHHWSKTKHGLHLGNAKAILQSEERIGTNLVDTSIS